MSETRAEQAARLRHISDDTPDSWKLDKEALEAGAKALEREERRAGYARAVLEHSNNPTVSTPREPVDNFNGERD